MKTKISLLVTGLIAGAIAFTACNKGESNIASSAESITDSDIAVAATDSTVSKDSVYFKHECGNGSTRDSIAESALPAGVATYLETNYPEYTFAKAFSVMDSADAVTGYVAAIYYNDEPVAVEFDASGEFVRVLERRGFGTHRGGKHD